MLLLSSLLQMIQHLLKGIWSNSGLGPPLKKHIFFARIFITILTCTLFTLCKLYDMQRDLVLFGKKNNYLAHQKDTGDWRDLKLTRLFWFGLVFSAFSLLPFCSRH